MKRSASVLRMGEHIRRHSVLPVLAPPRRLPPLPCAVTRKYLRIKDPKASLDLSIEGYRCEK